MYVFFFFIPYVCAAAVRCRSLFLPEFSDNDRALPTPNRDLIASTRLHSDTHTHISEDILLSHNV